MKLLHVLTHRSQDNSQFHVQVYTETSTGKFSATTRILPMTSKFILEKLNVLNFRTLNSDRTFTEVTSKVNESTGTAYLTSVPNRTTKDNIAELPVI